MPAQLISFLTTNDVSCQAREFARLLQVASIKHCQAAAAVAIAVAGTPTTTNLKPMRHALSTMLGERQKKSASCRRVDGQQQHPHRQQQLVSVL